MNREKAISISELADIDLESLPDGANYIVDSKDKPVGVYMNIQYYKYLESLIIKLKDKLVDANDSLEGM